MIPARLPQFRLLAHTNLNQDYNHSILIAVLRALAAVEVTAAHLRAQVFPGLSGLRDPTLWYQALAFFTGFAHQAVVVFFLLSGWLVGGSLLNKLNEPRVITAYTVDRLTRLWIVLIPAFSLSLLVGVYTDVVDPSTASYVRDNDYSAIAFMGNLFGLQDIAVPRFGGNFPLWSLANETWYYVLFPLVVFPFTGKSLVSRCGATAAALALAAWLPGPLVLYFALWLLGVAFSRVEITAAAWQRWAVFVTWAAVSVYFRLYARDDALTEESFTQHLLFSLLFLVLLSGLQFKADFGSITVRAAKKIGTALAGFSFTLYVIHVPLLMLMQEIYPPPRAGRLSPNEIGDLGVYGLMLAGVLVFSYLFHLPFEAQTHRVRSFLKRKLVDRTGSDRSVGTTV